MPDTKISGQCIDACTGLPLSGVTIPLMRGQIINRNGYYIGTHNPTQVTSVVTSDDGSFEITFKHNSTYDYWIPVALDYHHQVANYFQYENEDGILLVHPHDNKDVKFAITKKAMHLLKLHVTNTNPFSSSDRIDVSVAMPFTYLYSIYNTTLFGVSVNNLIELGVTSCSTSNTVISYTVTKNGISTVQSISANLTSGDVSLSFNY